MLRPYKYIEGTNRDPKVRISLHSDKGNFENPIQIVQIAGADYQYSPIQNIYLLNDSFDITYPDLFAFVIDHDTSDGTSETSWIQLRYLHEFVNSQNENEAFWTDWMTGSLRINDVIPATVVDRYEQTVALTDKVLNYYAAASPSEVRDVAIFQVRCKIPIDYQGEIKTDLTISFKSGTPTENTDGRP